MASINDTAATSALNENQYINKVYDNVIDKQKNLLKENYTTAGGELDAEKQSVQQQTNTNLGRVNVEAQKIKEAYKGPKLSAGAQQQAALAMDNQQKKNVTTMKTVQSEADAEIERQRKLLGEQYAAAIKKAQADNDMLRAQQLYEAAKAEDEQLLALKQEAGTRLAAMGDNSVLSSLLHGGAVQRDTTSETWAEVRKREGDINKIYDSALESDRQAAQMVLNEALSKIEAEQAAETATTDKNLTQTYVNALKNAKNYDEVQGAYGLGSGTLAQARLARALGLTGDLTEQRGVQMGHAAKRGQQRFSAGQVYRDAIAKSVETNENKRAQELYKAAEAEEQALVSTQKSVGEALAKQGNYSVLAKLWGLNQDQIDRLQGTGAYAPSYGGGGSGGRYYGDGGDDESYGNSYEAVNPSVLDLGYGPISKQELERKVESGEVLMFEKEDGSIDFVKAIDNTPGSSAGAAIKAAIDNGGKPLFVSASQKETVADKIGNAVNNIPIIGNVTSAIAGAIEKAYSKPSSSKSSSSGGGSSVHTSSSGTTHGGSGGSWGSSTKVDAVTSAAPKVSSSSSSSSASRDNSAYWSSQPKTSSSSTKSTSSSSSKSTSSSSKSSSSSSSSKSSSSGGSILSKVTNAIKSWFK